MWWCDIETFCETPISYGTAKYAEKAELMLLAWGWKDGPIHIWDLTTDPVMPDFLKVMLASDEPIVAHNSQFESEILTPLFNIDPKRWRCSMAKCYAHALPGALEDAGAVLGLPLDQQKYKDGKRLINLFCKPLPKNSKILRATSKTHPVEWQRFKDYCVQDVGAMREVWKRSPSWNYPNLELEFWQLDQRINKRGLPVDLELARKAIEITDREKKRLNAKTFELTQGEIKAATQRDALIHYIADTYDINFEDLKGSTVETFIEKMTDIPTELGELLLTRLQSNRASAAKYKRIFNWESQGRLKYTYQYCGASRTKRWSGRGPQGQNLKRPVKYVADQWDFIADAVKADAIDLLFDDPMEVIGSMVRGAIISSPDKKLVVSDLSGIEGCVLPWLAGEETELKRLRDNFNGIGFDSYVWSYSSSFGVKPATVTKDQRKQGKPISLAFGYGGGAGSLASFAAIYGVDIDDMALHARPALPSWALEEAQGMWKWATADAKRSKKITRGLKEDTFVVCDALKRVWRHDHPYTNALWDALEEGFKFATENKGKDFVYKRLVFRRDGAWLRIKLPSGTYLCYPSPRCDDEGISFMGREQFTKKWTRIYTFGGKLAENVTSGTARDILKYGLIAADKSGYDPIGHSHDEIISETPDSPDFSSVHLSELMTTGLTWTNGLPLAAAGYESYRYRKD